MSVEHNADQNANQVSDTYQQHYRSQPQPATQAQPVTQPQPATQPQPQPQPQPVAQPQPQAQGALQGKQHVHHSYIWLGSLRAIGVLVIVLIVGNIASLATLLREATYNGAANAMGLALILGLGILAILAVFGLFAGFTALSYKHLYYEVGPNEFSLYSGILSKKKVHVPYQRIQSVDQKASILQRLFGVCNVSIDTAGGAANKAILIPYLTKQAASALKSELYARKALAQAGYAPDTPLTPDAAAVQPLAATQNGQATTAAPTGVSTTQPADNILDAGEQAWTQIGGVFASGEVALEPVTYEYGLSNKELILTGLSNNSSFILIVAVVIAFLAQAFSFVLDIAPESGEFVFDSIATSAVHYGVMQVSAVLTFAFIAIVFVVWILSSIGACLQYGGFHARRRGSRIEVERGLLQHQSQSVSIDRVQSVSIKQTFIRRIFGYCEISLGKIDAMDGSNNSEQAANNAQQGMIIHPFVKVARINEILSGIIPEYADVPVELTKVSKVALRRGIIRRCILQGGGFWLAVFVALCQLTLTALEPFMDFETLMALLAVLPFVNILYLLAIVIFAIDIVGTVFWARGSGFAYNKRFMTVKNGGLSVNTVSFPRQKIQFGYTRTNPFQRAAKTATICAVTAAGIGGTSTVLFDVTQEDADRWLTWLEPYKS
ncbi:MAG: PH domain-containing protein [Eggerthellaceae bacterium]|nr:PH domain-containing protein [Eggerthellaceae bacterium]